VWLSGPCQASRLRTSRKPPVPQPPPPAILILEPPSSEPGDDRIGRKMRGKKESGRDEARLARREA